MLNKTVCLTLSNPTLLGHNSLPTVNASASASGNRLDDEKVSFCFNEEDHSKHLTSLIMISNDRVSSCTPNSAPNTQIGGVALYLNEELLVSEHNLPLGCTKSSRQIGAYTGNGAGGGCYIETVDDSDEVSASPQAEITVVDSSSFGHLLKSISRYSPVAAGIHSI